MSKKLVCRFTNKDNDSQLDYKDYLLENFDSEEYVVDENLYLKNNLRTF